MATQRYHYNFIFLLLKRILLKIGAADRRGGDFDLLHLLFFSRQAIIFLRINIYLCHIFTQTFGIDDYVNFHQRSGMLLNRINHYTFIYLK